jgi:hypothetical protein
MKKLVLRGLMAVSLPLTLVVGAAAAETAAGPAKPDDAPACGGMMPQSSPQGRHAMWEFMQSERAPQVMGQMMEMARRMGDGDATLGMTRMMEMMGQGGMMQPRGK